MFGAYLSGLRINHFFGVAVISEIKSVPSSVRIVFAIFPKHSSKMVQAFTVGPILPVWATISGLAKLTRMNEYSTGCFNFEEMPPLSHMRTFPV